MDAGAGRPDVIIFSRPGCSYCNRAKALLTERGVRYGVVDVSAEPERRTEAVELSGGAQTVPQIFVGRRCLGGFDDIKRRDVEATLLQALVRGPDDGESIAPTPSYKLQSLTGESGGVGTLPEAAQAALRQRAHQLLTTRYAPGSRPSLRAFLHYAVTKRVAQDQRSNVPLNFSASPTEPAPPPALPGESAADLAGKLRQAMFLLIDKFTDPATGDVQYEQMKESQEWGIFRAVAAELGYPRLKDQLLGMGEADRKAFLINLYNAMTFHGVVTYGRRPGWWYLYCFFITPIVSYSLAGIPVSLDDVENGMLRRQPGYFEAEGQGFQRGLRMAELDARIHMALNCGAKGCPAVGVYHGPTLNAELDEAVSAFVADDVNLAVRRLAEGEFEVSATELFKMYIADFAGSGAKADSRLGQVGVLQWALPYVRGEKRQLLSAALGSSNLRFTWSPYNWSTNGPDVQLDSRVYTPTF